MEIAVQDLIDAYQEEALPKFDENILRERGESFVNTIFAESQFLSETSLGIEAEAIGAI
jgi:hypothetical protein